MAGYSVKGDWKEHEPYLLLLSKFVRFDAVNNYLEASHWESVLLEKPLAIIDFLVEQGALEPASLHAHIDNKFKLSELKSIAKQRGIKVSGLKDELIERLVLNDRTAMQESVSGSKVLTCTTKGKQIAEQYLSTKKQQRSDTEKTLFNLLKNNALEKAAQLMINYESSQVFSRGLNIDWKSSANLKFLVSRLELIFQRTPALLKFMPDENLLQVRIATAMIILLGEPYRDACRWLPDNFDTGLSYSVETVVSLLIVHTNHIQTIQDCLFYGTKKVKIYVVNDHLTCMACEKLSGKKFKTSEVPELPHVLCTCDTGCRCKALAADYE